MYACLQLLVNHVIGLAQLRQLDVCVFALVFKNSPAAPELSYSTTPPGVASFCPPHYECNVIQAFCINALKQLSIHFKDCLVASCELATDPAYMWQHSDARLKIWHGSQVTKRNLLSDEPDPYGMRELWHNFSPYPWSFTQEQMTPYLAWCTSAELLFFILLELLELHVFWDVKRTILWKGVILCWNLKIPYTFLKWNDGEEGWQGVLQLVTSVAHRLSSAWPFLIFQRGVGYQNCDFAALSNWRQVDDQRLNHAFLSRTNMERWQE